MTIVASDDVKRRLAESQSKLQPPGLAVNYFHPFELTVGELRECCGNCQSGEHADLAKSLIKGCGEYPDEAKVVVDRTQIEAIVGTDAAAVSKSRRAAVVATPPPAPTQSIET